MSKKIYLCTNNFYTLFGTVSENRCNLTIYSDFEYSVTKIISEL